MGKTRKDKWKRFSVSICIWPVACTNHNLNEYRKNLGQTNIEYNIYSRALKMAISAFDIFCLLFYIMISSVLIIRLQINFISQ